ncbi:hypothetical protein CC80DRAFT_407503, partial [Byssothecium circinans]
PLTIVPAPANTRADIHILFTPMGASETQYAFTNMIADGLSLSPGLINITFNDDYTWTDDRLFNFTALHEIGHALGLSHSKVEDAVMFAYYGGLIREISPDDEAAVHVVYGWREPRWRSIGGGGGDAGVRGLVMVSSTSTSSVWDKPARGDGIYQLRSTGKVLYYSPSSGTGTGTGTGTWLSIDNNKDTVQITGANGFLYQRHVDGSIYKYRGTGSEWQYIGAANENVMDIVAAADQIYLLGRDGLIARWTGGTGTSQQQQWTTIHPASSPAPIQIVITDSQTLWLLLASGSLLRSSPPYSSLQLVDTNPLNAAIAVGAENFYKLQSDGQVVWLDPVQYFWSTIEEAGSVGVYAVGAFVYSRHGDGSLWRYTGTPGVWEMLDKGAGGQGEGEGKEGGRVVGDRTGGVWARRDAGAGEVWELVS